ncbi:hypothetical protein ACJZL1_02055 [Wolbachia endosymbiont of Rhagoletis indifferens]|uniref:hypothetical protein n=1 Tax=Wolbachia endosymbiont of Rhagoletis indifferens TaxID=3383250 RepID=UPI003AF3B843
MPPFSCNNSSLCLFCVTFNTYAPRRYDGSWWHDDNFVIPLLVSGIYAKILGEIRNFSVFCLVLAKDLHETLPIWLL